jgi:hypothetical protein
MKIYPVYYRIDYGDDISSGLSAFLTKEEAYKWAKAQGASLIETVVEEVEI